MTGQPAVLVVRFGALGDLVLVTPLLRALRRAYADAELTLATKRRWAPLFAAHPHVTHVEALDPDEPLRALAGRLRHTRWDLRVDLHGSLRSRALRLLVGGRWRAWRKPRLRRGLAVWTGARITLPPVATQYFTALRGLGILPDGGPPEIVPIPDDDARAAAIVPADPFVALVPGAAHATKRWPAGHWDALASLLHAGGIPAVVVGTPTEGDLIRADGIVRAAGAGLGVTAAVLRRAAVTVAGDTGLMHLATAVGTPVVALFGPTVPDLGYGPHGPGAVLARDLPCRPCSVYGGRHCPMRHHRCMIDITPSQVADAVQEYLG